MAYGLSSLVPQVFVRVRSPLNPSTPPLNVRGGWVGLL